MTFKELCKFVRKHGLSITIEPDLLGSDHQPSIRIRGRKDNIQSAQIINFEDMDNDDFINYMFEHIRCSIESAIPKTTTYLEEFKKHNPHIYETSRLIYERCPGNYFTDGPIEGECQNPESVECIGCTACWNQKCTGLYFAGRKLQFPYDAEEIAIRGGNK